MTKQWRVCLDCGTEWLADEVAEEGACPDCGGPTTPTDPNRASAHKTYIHMKRDVRGLLDLLRLELDRHAEYAAKEGVSHAHAGDLSHVRRKLIETLAFLAQQDEEFVIEALADIAAGRPRAEGRPTD